ncbi:uncharacterized protein [Macrobrachium rosenbergii]|uniref:uncharacterized protein n=1 Tax=Macrobrachium rosenbergii TaxID=79674 RepID=UPI0034D5C623
MYMADVGERTFNSHPKPKIYPQYIDNISITIDTDEEVTCLQYALKSNSSLNFTIEYDVEGRLPFLDVNVEKKGDRYNTTVYKKAINVGQCLNADGECPDTYKCSVAATYMRLAITHCSSWKATHAELQRVTQLLTNNRYNSNLKEGRFNTKTVGCVCQHTGDDNIR